MSVDDPPSTMRAATRRVYGSPQVVTLENVPVPRPKRGEVLVRVRATSLNSSDWEGLTGSPAYVRVFGLFKPQFPILGSDIAGEVVSVGEGVADVKRGDAVMADTMGTFGGLAEYARVPQRVLSSMPQGLTFEQAAALPQASSIAWKGIQEQEIQAGQRVLIVGAGGGSGSLAIQLAKRAGAHVTAIDNGLKLSFMSELGADQVLDYTQEDVMDRNETFDLILDLVATRSLAQNSGLLSPGGRYLMVGGEMSRLFQTLLLGPLQGLASGKTMSLLTVPANLKAAREIGALVASGALKLPVAETYSLSESSTAFARLGAGRVLGKVVVTM